MQRKYNFYSSYLLPGPTQPGHPCVDRYNEYWGRKLRGNRNTKAISLRLQSLRTIEAEISAI